MAGSLLLCGCGTFPLPRVYMLGAEPRSAPGLRDETGLPRLELKTVTVPDYLDTTDLVRLTAANEVVASTTGRWADRVSIGITHALATDLATRLPNVVIESGAEDESAGRILVNVERFDIGEDGRCTLTARWRIATHDDKIPSTSEEGTFVVAAGSTKDAAVSLAMSAAIDQLSGRIAATVAQTS
jgi:uncharacterized lipoprotein YmbA